MTSQKYSVESDRYCYPNSEVLINRLNITDADTLLTAEQELTALAAAEIEYCPPPYTLSTWKDIHKQLFSDIYPFAGEIRTVDISKGETRFANVQFIEQQADRLFSELATKDWLLGLERPLLVSELADLYGELNVLHPFREGNGRSQRVLFQFITTHAGFTYQWGEISQQNWIEANIAAYHGNAEPMRGLFDKIIKGEIG